MALPKFYLEPRVLKQLENETNDDFIKRQLDQLLPINMFYSVNGSRLQYFTGHRIKRKYYKDYKVVKSNTSPSELQKIKVDRSNINKIISDQAPYVNQVKNDLTQMGVDVMNLAITWKNTKKDDDDKKVTIDYLKEQLDFKHKQKDDIDKNTVSYNFISFYEKLIKDSEVGFRVMKKGLKAGTKYSANAIKNYGSSLSAVKRYMKYSKIKELSFNDINKNFYEAFRHFCYIIENKEISTFAGFIKDIKTVMNEAYEAELQIKNGHKASSFIMPSYKADTIYLNEDQLKQITDLDLSDNDKYETIDIIARKADGTPILDKNGDITRKKKKVGYNVLDKARDLFIIGAWSGLRFGNYANLERSNIQGDRIVVTQIKTETEVKIYIPKKKLQPTIDKYPEHFPKMSNQRFNDYIKIVARLAGLTEEVDKKSFKGNSESTQTVPLYSLVSSHAARRSFATNMYKTGDYTESDIMAITGHKSSSSFYKYIRLTNQEKADKMADKMQANGY